MSTLTISKEILVGGEPEQPLMFNVGGPCEPIPETNDVEKKDVEKVYRYDPIPDIKCYVQCDYMGNIYLKHDDTYYMVYLDVDSPQGTELVKMKNVNPFRETLKDNQHLASHLRSGTIKSGNTTLSGRAYEAMTDMTVEEREDYMLKNDYCVNDHQFIERKYFWVQYDEEDEPLEDEEDTGFYLNGVINEDDIADDSYGMVHSDLLFETGCSFDTMLIGGDLMSKHVVSNCERVDGYCTSRLTIFTSGHFRCNFIDKVTMGRICLDGDELVIKAVTDNSV